MQSLWIIKKSFVDRKKIVCGSLMTHSKVFRTWLELLNQFFRNNSSFAFWTYYHILFRRHIQIRFLTLQCYVTVLLHLLLYWGTVHSPMNSQEINVLLFLDKFKIFCLLLQLKKKIKMLSRIYRSWFSAIISSNEL